MPPLPVADGEWSRAARRGQQGRRRGCVLGAGGYLAANKVAENMGAKKWWQPTPEMEKYVATYLQ